MKYKVGDLVTTGLHLYLVVNTKHDRYYVRETMGDSVTWWYIHDVDNDRDIEKIS